MFSLRRTLIALCHGVQPGYAFCTFRTDTSFFGIAYFLRDLVCLSLFTGSSQTESSLRGGTIGRKNKVLIRRDSLTMAHPVKCKSLTSVSFSSRAASLPEVRHSFNVNETQFSRDIYLYLKSSPPAESTYPGVLTHCRQKA